jgi:CBS domain-containing protein
MHNRKIGSVIVVEDRKEDTTDNRKKGIRKLYGIFTERDLLTKVLSRDISLNEKVKGYCSVELITADIGTLAAEAAKTMLISKIKRLPLVTRMAADTNQTKESSTSSELIQKDDKSNVAAIVTARDLVDAFQKT